MNTPFIVAELSANHLGSFARAVALVEAAAEAGASAIKLQTYTPEQMCEPDFVIASGPWAGRNLLDLYKACHTPRPWHAPLFARAKELGMEAFSSVFHPDDVDFLETLDCPRYKISSFELLDLPLIQHAAATKKPLILSTGMGTWEEIKDAAFSAFASGCRDLTLLKCVSGYPAEPSEMNLVCLKRWHGSSLDTLHFVLPENADRFIDPKVGVSDHTLGLAVPVAATALGASMIEKHLTLSRADGGPDAAFSSEPHEFAAMVKACREAHAALGKVRYGPTPSEMSSLPLRRKPGGKRGG